MKKIILSIVTFSLLIFGACAQQKKTTAKKEVKAETAVANMGIEQIVMERTPCFGSCPAYRIEINKDGLLKYIGRSDVDYKGIYETTIDPVQVKALFNEFNKYKVDTCADNYDMQVSDFPGLSFSIKYIDKEKSINNANFGPDFLNDLSRKVDEHTKVNDTWKKTGEID